MKKSELRQFIREELIQLKSELFAELTYKREGKNWIIKYTYESEDGNPTLNAQYFFPAQHRSAYLNLLLSQFHQCYQKEDIL